MDSDTSDDMASGSKARDRGLRGDKVPLWKEVNKATFADWWYDFDSYCATNGLERTVNGDDRGIATLTVPSRGPTPEKSRSNEAIPTTHRAQRMVMKMRGGNI